MYPNSVYGLGVLHVAEKTYLSGVAYDGFQI